MPVITCNKCFLSYCNDLNEDIELHNKLHNKYINLAKISPSFDDNFINFTDENLKLTYLENIKNSNNIDEKFFNFKKLSQMYYSRSVLNSEFNVKHPEFNEYVSMLINNNILNLKNEHPEFYTYLVKIFGTKKGLKNGSTIFKID